MANIFDDIFKNLKSKEQKNVNPNINTIDSNLNSTGSVFSAPNQSTLSAPKANTSKIAADKPTQTKASTSTKKENNMDFFTKYFTKEGTASLPNDSVWKKLDQGLSGNNANISMNSNNIGFGTSDVNPKNVSEGKKLYEESILESNQKKLAEGTASPLLKTQNWLNTAIQGGDDIIGSQIKRANQEKLDEEFTPYVDTDAINEKIKLDKNYATKLIDNQGKLIDYGEKINQLKAQLDNTHNSFDKDQIQMQLDAIYSIQEDQKKLQYSSYYEYLKQKGATEDEINEFKNYVISQDDVGIKRVLEFVGGTVESWAGSFVKAVNGLYGAVAKLTGMDYDPNSDNSTANAIIDNAEQLMINAQTNASGVERDIYEIYGGISPFVYDTILALATSGSSLAEMAADPAKAKQLADRALLLADISVFGSKIKEDMDEGYDFDAAFVNSVAHAALNHITESVIGKGTDRIVEFATNSFASKAAQKITENYVVYTAKYLAQSFGGEALEEGFEGLAEPIIDGITLKGGITLDQYLNQVLNGNIIHQMYVGGMGGLLMGGVNVTKATIQSKIDYENIKNWRKVLVDLYNSDESFNANDYMFIQDQINDCNDMLRDYTEKNPFINAFLTEDDKNIIDINIEEAHNLYKKAESVEIQKGLQPILEAKQQMLTKENELYAALDQKLKQENINMSAVDYENLSSEAKVNTSITAKVAQQLNKTVNFANLVDKNGDIVDGVVVNGQTIINPNAKLGALSTLMHEYTHGVENSKYYGKLKKVVKDFFGDGYDAAISKIKDDYSTIAVLNNSDAEKELVAITTQSLLDQYSFIQDMVKYNNSLAFKMYQDIKNLGGIVGDKFQKIEYNFMRAFDDAQALATTGSEAVDFSYIKNADIMMAQKMYLQDQIASKNAKVDPKVLEAAQQDMTVMADLMSTNSNLLPTEVIGKVLLKDASYGLSVENSTKCPRTLAYDELTNYVSENVGRPLTAIESFLVSQKLYSIAVDPQCLYCYVALDRKSYNEFVGRYIDQRNDVIKAYRDAGSPKIRNYNNAETAASNDKLFRDFLDGRKPTINMWQRYKSWIDAYNSGEGLLTKKDVASDWSRSEIQKAGGSKAEQLKDALAYAQSASWAKKSYEYRAYFDDIRKLSDRKIKELNKHYGLRWYSFNDYTPAYILENMQQFTDAALRGLKGLAYTKDADFARIFAPTGVNINISVFARKNANGNYEIDPVQSANLQEAIELRNKYNNVGIVVTATDAEGVRWAMDQEWSDVVIPFHIVRTGADIAQYYKWSVFNAEQNDTVADKNVWKNYVESLNKPEKKVSKMIYPSEHQNNYELYKKLCEERGLKPRFASFEYNEDGTVNKNYMKLVNETRQSDLETTTLQPIFDQDAALESFERFKNKGGFYGGWYRDGVDLQTEANEVANDILEIEQGLKKYEDIKYGEGYVNFKEYLEMKKQKNKVAKMHGKGTVKASLGIKASDLTNYSTAVKDGDIDVAGKIVAKIAAEKGYNIEAFHGTPTNKKINVFDSESGLFFFTDSKDAAEWYRKDSHGDLIEGSQLIPAYLKMENPLIIDAAMRDWEAIPAEAQDKYGNVIDLSDKTYYDDMLSEDRYVASFTDDEIYTTSTNDAAGWARENGYDGLIVKDVIDDGEDNIMTEYVVFNSNNIKSADPVTYDADGNMIPLEERFDLNNKDIRYSKGVSLADIENYQAAAEVNDADAAQAIVDRVANEKLASSKARDEFGNLKKMMHGTNTSEIVVFDPKKSDDKISLFFTDNPRVADTYITTDKAGVIDYSTNVYKTIDEFNNGNKRTAERIGVINDKTRKMLLDAETTRIKRIIKDSVNENEKSKEKQRLKEAKEKYKNFKDGQYYVYLEQAPYYMYKGVYDDLQMLLRKLGGTNEYLNPERLANRYDVYLDIKNPLTIDAEGRNWNRLPAYAMETTPFDKKYNNFNKAEDINKLFKELGVSDIYEARKINVFNMVVNGENLGSNNDGAKWEYIEIYKDGVRIADLDQYYEDIPTQAGRINVLRNTLYENKVIDYDTYKKMMAEVIPVDIDAAGNDIADTRTWAAYANDNGYDGLIIKNVVDNGGKSEKTNANYETSTVMVVFDSNQVKSADPFTYNDQGNLIPLDQRFNDQSDDIRFSNGISIDDLIEDTNDEGYYTYDNLISQKPIEINDYTLSNFTTIDDRNKKRILQDSITNAIKDGCIEYNNDSYAIINDKSKTKIYVNDKILNHAENGKNNKYVVSTIENLYSILKSAIPINKSFETGSPTNRFATYYNYVNFDGDPTLVRVVTSYGNIESVNAVAYATNTKKGSTHGNTPKGSASYTISIKELLNEINSWDQSFRKDLPRDVQLRLNNSVVEKSKYTNRYSKGVKLDSLGKEITPAQNDYFKNSKARDDQGKLLTLYHGSPNATFTVFNDTEDPRYDQGKNPNNAIYLTTNLDVARGFSDSDKVIDPYKIYSTETVDDFNRVVKESGYDFELMQLEEIYPDSEKVKNYYLVGNGDDICSSMDQGDMEQYYDLWDALEDYDDEAETYKLNVGSTVEEALQSIKELMPVDKGNYQVYANATNPFVVDCDGSLWSEIKTPKEIATDKETMTTREIEDWVAQNGEYDSIIFKNIVDPAPYAINQEQESDIVVVFDSNQIKSTNNLNPTFDSDIRYSKGISLEEIEEDNKWSRETTDIIDDVNSKIGSDLTVEDIDDILHQRPINPKTIDAIENTKKVMIDEADKWIKGYATIKAEYPIFSKDTLNNALYEVLIYGDLTESTYNSMANTISSEFAYEGIDGDIRQEINDFINESLNTFNNEAKYKAGEIDKDQVRKAIVENNAYNQRDIQGSFDRMAEGSAMNRLSSDIKKDYQAEYQPIVDNLIKQDVVTRETKGRKIDSKVSDWKTMDQNIFELANGNPDLYKTLMDKIRYECLDSAADRKATMLKSAQDDVINKVRELGIKEGSKEDIAVQYVLEGHTEQFRDDIDLKSPDITQESIDEFKRNPYMPYTQEMLKNQYNYDMDNGKKAWENINAAADIIREAYEDAFSKVTMTQIAANGDVEGNADYETTQLLVELDNAFTTLESIKDEIRRNGSKESTQAAYEIAERKYNQLVKQYNARIDKDSKGDLTRRQLTPHRENYSHHIVKRNVISTFNSIRNAELLTPTELAGTSDYTNPNTAWSSFSAAQDGGKYTPTALGSYAAYIKEAADVVAYNPVILELRQFNKDIKATAQGTTLNRFSEYLNDYCNMLAGKRNNLDRGFQKLAGAKVMRTITALNSYAKQAALVGNFRSALVQFANIPNGLGILESSGGKNYVGDVGKGIVDWIKTFGNTDTTAIDQSSFMTNRYFDLDTGRSGVGEKIKDAADFLLSAGDKVGAEIIWWSAYEQGTRQGVDNAVQYADEITRSAIAGRTKEDMALAMQSQVVNLFLPFQVENNNLFQTLKQETSSRKGGALATYMVAAYLFNEIIKYITGGDDEVLPEFITPIIEEIKKVIDGEKTIDDAATNSFLGEIAEAISLTPAGQQIVGLMFGDDSDTVFGEYNPARYGNTNIGLSGVGKIVKDLKQNEVPSVALTKAAEDLVGGYVKGGKQITRTVGGLQSMGALPKLKQDGEIEISPINYSGSGKISYVNDQNNIADWIRAALFGKSNTSEAQKYYDSFKTLSDADARIFNALQSSDNNYYENFKEVKAFKEAKANDKANASLRDQLKEDGKYDDYIRSIQSSYQSYLNTFDYETNEEGPKTYEQYAKQFGLTSDELKEDSYDNFYKAYNITDSKQKVISEMSKVENVKNALGKTIANSGATLRRIAYEEAGIYDQILEYIDANGLEYSDFGLSKTVVGYDQTDIAKMVAKINGVKYEETAGSSNGSSGSSSSSDAKKAKKAMKAYLKALKSRSTKNSSIKNNMTTVQNAQSKAEKIISDSLKSVK